MTPDEACEMVTVAKLFLIKPVSFQMNLQSRGVLGLLILSVPPV